MVPHCVSNSTQETLASQLPIGTPHMAPTDSPIPPTRQHCTDFSKPSLDATIWITHQPWLLEVTGVVTGHLKNKFSDIHDIIFLKLQIEFVLQEKPQLKDSKDWKELYASLRRKFGLREEFTEMLMLCRKCCALFWKNLGHPCFVFDSDFDSSDSDTAMADNSSSMSSKSAELIPVSPKSFLTFFSVRSLKYKKKLKKNLLKICSH